MTAHPPHTIHAQQLAARLAELFERDAALAGELGDAARQLQHANDRLWTGLDPDGLTAVYGHHPQFETIRLEAALAGHCDILRSENPVAQIQQAHWEIHRSFVCHQHLAERRRQLAADIGELVAELVTALTATGWTEQQARTANLRQLANEVGERP
jgi:hypothetical protein